MQLPPTFAVLANTDDNAHPYPEADMMPAGTDFEAVFSENVGDVLLSQIAQSTAAGDVEAEAGGGDLSLEPDPVHPALRQNILFNSEHMKARSLDEIRDPPNGPSGQHATVSHVPLATGQVGHRQEKKVTPGNSEKVTTRAFTPNTVGFDRPDGAGASGPLVVPVAQMVEDKLKHGRGVTSGVSIDGVFVTALQDDSLKPERTQKDPSAPALASAYVKVKQVAETNPEESKSDATHIAQGTGARRFVDHAPFLLFRTEATSMQVTEFSEFQPASKNALAMPAADVASNFEGASGRSAAPEPAGEDARGKGKSRDDFSPDAARSEARNESPPLGSGIGIATSGLVETSKKEGRDLLQEASRENSRPMHGIVRQSGREQMVHSNESAQATHTIQPQRTMVEARQESPARQDLFSGKIDAAMQTVGEPSPRWTRETQAQLKAGPDLGAAPVATDFETLPMPERKASVGGDLEIPATVGGNIQVRGMNSATNNSSELERAGEFLVAPDVQSQTPRGVSSQEPTSVAKTEAVLTEVGKVWEDRAENVPRTASYDRSKGEAEDLAPPDVLPRRRRIEIKREGETATPPLNRQAENLQPAHDASGTTHRTLSETTNDKGFDPNWRPDNAPVVGKEPTSGPAVLATSLPGSLTARSEIAHHAATQISHAIHHSGVHSVELHLRPEELGHVRLSMSGDQSALNVSLSVERADTLDLMRRHADVLGNELRRLGYGSVNFTFEGGGFTGRGDGGPQGEAAPRSAHNEMAHDQIATDTIQVNRPERPSRAADSGIDIRL